MSIDTRTRRYDEIRRLTYDEVVDEVLPAALDAHGDLAARGASVLDAPSLGFDLGHTGFTFTFGGGSLRCRSGIDSAQVVAELEEGALARLVQDVQTTMGLAMTSDVHLSRGTLDDWIGWEPILRALFDGRPVYESGSVELLDADGTPLDLTRSFTLDDDRAELEHFLTEAGFVHLTGVYDQSEMDAVAADLDAALAAATPDDGASWWATDADGVDRPVRVLWFDEQSDATTELLGDDRLTWLADLTGDTLRPPTSAEGLVKPLGIVRGLSDLPWHKDCGQGHHSYVCSGMTVGISVTGADVDSGALGVIAGSHRANTLPFSRDARLDLPSLKLETRTGDLTVHCSDTLHRAYPPVTQPRKVVYTSIRLAPLPGDEAPRRPNAPTRESRADLTSVTDRIEAADDGKTRIGG